MAASANPSGDNNPQEGVSNGNAATTTVSPSWVRPRLHCGTTQEWTPDEQTLLRDLLAKYASESYIVRCAKIAKQLKDKTVRDVALHCRWINKKENGKRRKEDNNSARKNKDKKEKVADPSAKSSSHLTNHSNGPPYAQTVISMDSDDGIPCEAIGLLLEQNAQTLDQISANFGAFKIHHNINLFCQARNNIHSILNDLNELPDIMKKMPPLPVKLDEELAGSILPQPSLQKKS